MGATVSKSKQDILVNTVSGIVNTVTTNYVNANSNKVKSDQELIIDYEGATINCDVNVTQTSDVKFSVLSTNRIEATATLTSEIVNKITAALDSASKQSISGLNLGQLAVNISDQKIQQQITSFVNSAITTTISNVLVSKAEAEQKLHLNFKGATISGAKCGFTQATQIEFFSHQVAENILQNAVTSGAVTEVDDTVKATSEQSLTGVSLMGLIGGGIGGFIVLIVIIVIIYKVVQNRNSSSE